MADDRARRASITELTDRASLERALEVPIALLYKHSTRCSVSRWAIRQVQQFVDAHPDVPTYLIDVFRHRTLSDHLEQSLQVGHESPQAILVRHGVPHWSGSHSRVSATVLAQQVRYAANDRETPSNRPDS